MAELGELCWSQGTVCPERAVSNGSNRYISINSVLDCISAGIFVSVVSVTASFFTKVEFGVSWSRTRTRLLEGRLFFLALVFSENFRNFWCFNPVLCDMF